MRLAIVSDAWRPQINGVVTTLTTTVGLLRKRGHEVLTITPDQFKTVPCPTYPEIRLALRPGPNMARQLDAFGPDAIHICTEGSLGLAARRYCRRRRLEFSTSLHTRFAEYVNLRLHTPVWMGYAYMRWFHRPAIHTMVATPSLKQELEERGFDNLALWSRGVDTERFHPRARQDHGWKGPVFVYLGRVAVEKNIEAFLKLELPGTKVVIGNGPAWEQLKQAYPGVVFTGALQNGELAAHLAAGDVFVFPSLTDTFGVVMLEAMACGLPVAAFPVRGPLEVVEHGVTGILDHDLRRAALQALELNRDVCREHASRYSWQVCTDQFVSNLAPLSSYAAEALATTA